MTAALRLKELSRPRIQESETFPGSGWDEQIERLALVPRQNTRRRQAPGVGGRCATAWGSSSPLARDRRRSRPTSTGRAGSSPSGRRRRDHGSDRPRHDDRLKQRCDAREVYFTPRPGCETCSRRWSGSASRGSRSSDHEREPDVSRDQGARGPGSRSRPRHTPTAWWATGARSTATPTSTSALTVCGRRAVGHGEAPVDRPRCRAAAGRIQTAVTAPAYVSRGRSRDPEGKAATSCGDAGGAGRRRSW